MRKNLQGIKDRIALSLENSMIDFIRSRDRAQVSAAYVGNYEIVINGV